MSAELDALESAIGHAFRRRALLERALTHASLVAESADTPGDYQRLEFLGDAVLQLVVSEYLYWQEGAAPEGAMSRTRSRLVSRESLAEVADGIGLAACIRVGRGAEQQGTRTQPRVLADVLEAIIGAVHVDGGFDAARSAVRTILASRLDDVSVSARAVDHKSRLQELTQRRYRQKPEYCITGTSGPPHDCVFHASASVQGKCLGEGSGRSKQEAQQEAAARALHELSRQPGDTEEADHPAAHPTQGDA